GYWALPGIGRAQPVMQRPQPKHLSPQNASRQRAIPRAVPSGSHYRAHSYYWPLSRGETEHLMSRLPAPEHDSLPKEAQAVWDNIAANRGGGMRGPFAPLMHVPSLAQRVATL